MRRLVLTAVLGGVLLGAGPAPAARAPGRMLVTATEFRFALSRATLPTGPALLQLSNRGQDAHDLVLRRVDSRGRDVGPRKALATVQPGATGTLEATLKAGRYVVYCTLPGHRGMGMQARFTVRP